MEYTPSVPRVNGHSFKSPRRGVFSIPSLIAFGVVNQNTPQQNAGLFMGEGNLGGWDANMKLAQGHGGTFGFFNIFPLQANILFDNLEAIDGMMNDMDFKPTVAANA